MPMDQDVHAVLFDLDGTLLDTLADIAAAMNRTLADRGLPVHESQAYRLMVGSGFEALVRRAMPEEKRDDAELLGELVRAMLQEYGETLTVKTRPYDGIPELTTALRRMGLPLAVLSNKADDMVQRTVGEFFPADTFAVVRGLRDGSSAKPDPTSAIGIAEELNVEPQTVVFLGDSDVDMMTAKNAGMLGIGAEWGFRGREELEKAGAARVISTPPELIEIIRTNKAGHVWLVQQ